MSFYGNNTNGSKNNQFVFDKVYPNRKTMDNNAKDDGVFVGRYVFVEYEDNAFPYRLGYQMRRPSFGDSVDLEGGIDGLVKDPTSEAEGYLLFADSTFQHPYSTTDENAGIGYGVKVGDIFYSRFTDDAAIEIQNAVIALYKDYIQDIENTEKLELLQEAYTRQNSPYTMEWEEFLTLSATKQQEYVNTDFQFKTYYYYYECSSSTVGIKYYDELGDPYVIEAAIFNWLFTSTDEHDSGGVNDYSLNYYLDKLYAADKDKPLNFTNGWDSTIWQKVYRNGKEEYMYVASLNSDLPQFTLKPEAPTDPPIAPHLGVESTNNNYSVHFQQPWGIRIKKATPSADGSLLSDVGIGPEYGEYTYYDYEQRKKVSLDEESYPYPGEIYFNAEAFDKVERHRDDRNENVVILSNGASGEEYITHNPDADYGISYEPANDLKELSIHLPAIGNAVSDLYDLMYADYEENGRIKDKRNLIIDWDADDKSEGARLVSDDPESGGFKYTPKAASSVAGTINTMHDLIGNIIIDGRIDATRPEDASFDNIYYLTEDKYGNPIRPGFFMKEAIPNFKTAHYDEYMNDSSVRRAYKNLTQFEPGKYYTRVPTAIEGKYNYFCDMNTMPQDGVDYYKWITPPEKLDLRPWNGGKEQDKDIPIGPDGQPTHIARNYYYDDEKGLVGEIIAEGCCNLTIDKTKFKASALRLYPDLDDLVADRYFFIYDKEKETWKFQNIHACDLKDYGIAYEGELVIPEDPEAEVNYRIDVFYGFGYYQDTAEYADSKKYYYFVEPTQVTSKEPAEDGSYLFTKFYKPDDYSEAYTDPDTGESKYRHKIINVIGDENYYTGYFCYNKETDTFKPIYYASEHPFNPEESYYFIENYYVEENQFDAETGKLVDIYYKDFAPLDMHIIPRYAVNLIEFIPDTYYRKIEYDTYLEYNEETRRVIDYVQINSLEDIDANLDYYTLKVTSITGWFITGADNPDQPGADDPEAPPEEDFDRTFVHFYTPHVYHYKRGNDYLLSRDDIWQPNREYYFLEAEPADETFYIPGKYRYVPKLKSINTDADGNEIIEFYYPKDEVIDNSPTMKVYPEPEGADYYIDEEEVLDNEDGSYAVYFIPSELYVKDDALGILGVGSAWNMNIKPPSTIELGTKDEAYDWKELVGFASNYNTIAGLILKLNRLFEFNDSITRNPDTVQGNINRTKDYFTKFDALTPGNLLLVDDYGRITSPDVVDDIWVQYESTSTVGACEIKFSHGDPSNPVYNYGVATEESQTLKFGGSFNALYFGVDAKGHVNNSNAGNYTITLPNLAVSDLKTEATNFDKVLTALQINSDGQVIDQYGINVGDLVLTGYQKGTEKKVLSESDSINSAFGQLEYRADTLEVNLNTIQGILNTDQLAQWSAAEENVQADWSETNEEADSFIQNKPDLSKMVETDTKFSYDPTDENKTRTIGELMAWVTQLESRITYLETVAGGGSAPADPDNPGTVTAMNYILETNNNSPQRFWRGTQEEYDLLTLKSEDTMYIIIEETNN